MAVMGGGVWVRIGGPVSVIPIDEGRQERQSAFDLGHEIECEVEHIDRDMLDKVFGPSTRHAMVSLVSERRLRLPRHRTVWEYRRDRKGCGRRGKARYVTMRTVFPNARVTPGISDGTTLSCDVTAEAYDGDAVGYRQYFGPVV